jgi:dolichyl-phosphate-mannose-protein mannosyltransferase
MAALDTAVSTGAKQDSNLRRRNVPGAGKGNSESLSETADEDTKKSSPQVRLTLSCWDIVLIKPIG